MIINRKENYQQKYCKFSLQFYNELYAEDTEVSFDLENKTGILVPEDIRERSKSTDHATRYKTGNNEDEEQQNTWSGWNPSRLL